MTINSKQKGATEVWKPVVGYEGLYEVSNLGRVKSLPKYNYKTERIMKLNRNKRDGRYSVILCKSPTEHKRIHIHRIVAQAFVENPKGYDEINHIDENPANNNASNLEWCDRKYNMNYGKMRKMYDSMKRPIRAFNEDASQDFDGFSDAEKLGYKRYKVVYAIEHGTKAYGYRWEYINEH